MSSQDDTKGWGGIAQPPPPMFLGQKEKDLVKQVNDELIEKVIGQPVAYYAIDYDNTEYHPIYGEAIVKNFYNPIRVHALVLWQGLETEHEDYIGVDRKTMIEVRFHRRRLNDDQNLVVREGDFVYWGGAYYEIFSVSNPRELWGQPGTRFEVIASCRKAREGMFDAT